MKKLILILLTICLITAALLGAVNAITVGPIEASLKAASDAAMQEVLPVTGGVREEVPFDAVANPLVRGVYRSAEGYVVEVAPSGFGGEIVMMVGVLTIRSGQLTSSYPVSGISIISMSETSGLGSKANDAEWREQFTGNSAPFAVKKDRGSIDAITGATVTSRAVTSGVNAAVAVVQELEGGVQ